MKITEVKCKTALSKSNLPGLTYSLNPYRGCQHNCAYCYVPNVLRIKREDWGNFVEVKTNIPNVLARELKNKKLGVVGISTVTDPYQPIEKKYKLTRYCLEQLLIHDFPVCIQTKSDLILRDIDIISRFSNSEILISIGTLNDDERKILEPNSSSIKNRLDILEEFSKNSIKTSVFFGPVYPTIKKQEIEQIIKTFYEKGVDEIMIDKMNFKPGILQNIVDSNYHFFSNKDYVNFYNETRESIIKNCKKYNLKITNAF